MRARKRPEALTRCPAALPVGEDSLILSYPVQGVKHPSVSPLLVWGKLPVGLPTDTKKIGSKRIQTAKRANIDPREVWVWRVEYGTLLINSCTREWRRKPVNFDKWDVPGVSNTLS